MITSGSYLTNLYADFPVYIQMFVKRALQGHPVREQFWSLPILLPDDVAILIPSLFEHNDNCTTE